MERHVAIKKLGQILGKRLGYRVDPNAPTAEEREEARAALPAAAEKKRMMSEAMEARRKAVLDADKQFQELVTAYRAASKEAGRLSSMSHHYKITVGTSCSLFFSVMAEGDSWEEVIEKLTAKKKAA